MWRRLKWYELKLNRAVVAHVHIVYGDTICFALCSHVRHAYTFPAIVSHSCLNYYSVFSSFLLFVHYSRCRCRFCCCCCRCCCRLYLCWDSASDLFIGCFGFQSLLKLSVECWICINCCMSCGLSSCTIHIYI